MICKDAQQEVINEGWKITSSRIGERRNNGLRQRTGLFCRGDLKSLSNLGEHLGPIADSLAESRRASLRRSGAGKRALGSWERQIVEGISRPWQRFAR